MNWSKPLRVHLSVLVVALLLLTATPIIWMAFSQGRQAAILAGEKHMREMSLRLIEGYRNALEGGHEAVALASTVPQLAVAPPGTWSRRSSSSWRCSEAFPTRRASMPAILTVLTCRSSIRNGTMFARASRHRWARPLPYGCSRMGRTREPFRPFGSSTAKPGRSGSARSSGRISTRGRAPGIRPPPKAAARCPSGPMSPERSRCRPWRWRRR